MDVAGDWGIALAEMKVPADVAPWRLGVVVSVESGQATIGLRPIKQSGGKLPKDRELGVIPLALAKWARKSRGKGKVGPEIKQMSDVLKIGDVVYAAPTRQGNQWHLVTNALH